MFVQERQSQILAELHEKGKVLVKDLSIRFQVSEDLIRKDLSALEERGLLKKAYGGAVLLQENVHREIASQRKHVQMEEKQKIAKLAYDLIQDGDIVFLDISTTNLETAKLLANSHKKVTIVTNMLDVMNILVQSPIRVIMIGGELDYGKDGFVGSLAMEMIKSFRFDCAFMGVVGVDIHDDAVMTYMADDGITKKEILKLSRVKYMLCENDKFHQLGNYTYAHLEDFNGILTNEKPTDQIIKTLLKYNLILKYS